MINLSKLNVGRYFIADAVSNVKKEKEIKLVQKLKTNLAPSYLLVKDTSIGPHSCKQLINPQVDLCLRSLLNHHYLRIRRNYNNTKW